MFVEQFVEQSRRTFSKVVCRFKGHLLDEWFYKYGTLKCVRCGAERRIHKPYVDPNPPPFIGYAAKK